MSVLSRGRSSGEERQGRRRPRRGARRTVLAALRRLPDYLRLLGGLMVDSRVSRIDRALVVLAAAYIVTPIDFIPDVIPFLGEVDDLFLLALSLQRLVRRTSRRVLLDHWPGDPEVLSEFSLSRMLGAAAFFLPARTRRRLERLADRG